MTNTAGWGVKYWKKNDTAGHRIEEIHIIAKGESPINLRTHPLSRTSAKVYTRLSSSPVGINNVIKRGESLWREEFNSKNKPWIGGRKKLQKEKHVFSDLVFIIHLISLCQNNAWSFFCSFKESWMMMNVQPCFAAPFHYRKHLKTMHYRNNM